MRPLAGKIALVTGKPFNLDELGFSFLFYNLRKYQY